MTSNFNDSFSGTGEAKLVPAIVSDECNEIEMLLRAGMDVNGRDALGATALYWAAYVGNTDWITTLLDLGADVGATTTKGETALHSAARRGKREAVLLLLDRGANVQAADLRQRTVLHAAVEEGRDNYEIASLLVEKGADVLVRDGDGQTALACTRGSKQQNIATLLKQKGRGL